jgi:hypothetical protein
MQARTLPASAAPKAGTPSLPHRRLSYQIFRDVDCGACVLKIENALKRRASAKSMSITPPFLI